MGKKRVKVYVYTEGLRTAEDKWKEYRDKRTGIIVSIKTAEGAKRLIEEGKIEEIK